MLEHCDMNETKAYKQLGNYTFLGYRPRGYAAIQRIAANKTPRNRTEARPESDVDDASSIIRHFDQHGFPPGTLSNGTALNHMALALHGSSPNDRSNGDGHINFTTRSKKTVYARNSPLKLVDEDDETSSEGSSSDSSSESVSDSSSNSDMRR